MTALDDLTLRPDEPGRGLPVPPKPRPPLGAAAGAAALLAAAAGLALWLWRKPPAAAPPMPGPSADSATTPAPTPAPTPFDLPALDASDALVRELARALSADPRFAAWLATPNLVRTLAASIVNVADGGSPAPHLGFLAPKGAFAVVRRKAGLVIDPKSYERYDALAEVVASIDAMACARVYGRLEPLLDLAYRELGYPQGRFRDVLARGLAHLLQTPVLEGDVAVKPVTRATLVYELADPGLEALSPAQKHLLRMGPASVRRIQASLRALRDALGAEGAGHEASPAAR